MTVSYQLIIKDGKAWRGAEIRPGGYVYVDSHEDVVAIKRRQVAQVDNLLWLLSVPSTKDLYVDTVICLIESMQ